MILKSQSFIKKGEEFDSIDQYSGILSDTDYIDGAIELSIDGKVLFDKRLWDHVDDLWSYILWGLEELSHGREYVTGFPDQPIEIHFRPLGDHLVEFEVAYGHGRKVCVNRNEFITGMLAEAEKFFMGMREISARSDGHNYMGELDKIAKVRSELQLR